MNNRLLHALSNRNGPFVEALFLPDPEFRPAVLGPEEMALRRTMFLDITTTDYYLKAYLAAVEAYPDIKLLAADPVTSYRMTDFPPRGVEMNGGDFLSKLNAVGFYTDRPIRTLPVNLTYRVAYVDTSHVEIIGVESRLIQRAGYGLSGESPRQTMRVQWPDGYPFSGPLLLSQRWEPGAMVEIMVAPSSFPYAVLVDRLVGNKLLLQWLSHHQLVDEYWTFPDPQRKIAIASVVLALENPAVYG